MCNAPSVFPALLQVLGEPSQHGQGLEKDCDTYFAKFFTLARESPVTKVSLVGFALNSKPALFTWCMPFTPQSLYEDDAPRFPASI